MKMKKTKDKSIEPRMDTNKHELENKGNNIGVNSCSLVVQKRYENES